MNAVILLSGGTGSRIHSEIPKQYVRVNGYMMVTYALMSIIESSYTDEVCITAASEWYDNIMEDIDRMSMDTGKILCFAPPGKNRQLSVISGMEEIKRRKDISGSDTILIHDAARPFLSAELIASCYSALSGHDGVMPVLPMKDTVYFSGNGKNIESLLDRGSIYAGQAPELFNFKKYYEANISLLPDKILNINGSAEPAVLAGMDVVMIPGGEKNFKITTDDDLKKYKEQILR